MVTDLHRAIPLILIFVFILIQAPIVIIHEWNHRHRPPVLSAAIGPSGLTAAILAEDKIKILPNEHPKVLPIMPVSGLGKIGLAQMNLPLTAKVLKSTDGPPQNGAKTIGDYAHAKDSSDPPR